MGTQALEERVRMGSAQKHFSSPDPAQCARCAGGHLGALCSSRGAPSSSLRFPQQGAGYPGACIKAKEAECGAHLQQQRLCPALSTGKSALC